MTDKEVIIDDVNVAGCDNYRPEDRFTCRPHICNCHERKDCYYKQLQRKEQELKPFQDEYFKGLSNEVIAELAKKSIRITAENSELEYNNERLRAENDILKQYKGSKQASYEAMQRRCNEVENKNRELQAENEELKEKYKWYDHYKDSALFNKDLCNKKSDEINRYKQALDEIKEKAQENNELLQGYHLEWANNKLILDIINEVLKDE